MALCIEAGKPIRDSDGEVTRLIDTFKVAAEEAVRIDGEIIDLEISARAKGYRGFVQRVPIGACSFITPFNFPLNLVAHKVAPAIAAGCPFVLKPAEKTPIGALIIGEVLAETDLPKRRVLGAAVHASTMRSPLVSDERIKLLSFTGGLVGWDLKAKAGRKKVVLELGGNAAASSMPIRTMRLDAVIERLIFGSYYQSGQSCIKVQRIYVHAAIYDDVRKRFVAATKKLKAGDPKKRDVFLGPMIDEDAAKRLESWIGEARKAGAKVLCGGKRERQHARSDRARERAARREDQRARSVRPGHAARAVRRFRRCDRGRQRLRTSACRRASSPTTSRTRCARGTSSKSAASSSTTCRASASTTCRTAASSSRASAAKACATRSRT